MATVVPTTSLPAAVATRLPGLSVVLPCLDEAENLRAVVADVAEAAAANADRYEIIVVDDGSTDDTARVANELRLGHPQLRLLVHARNRGYGDTLRTGINAARLDWVLLMDADRQFDPRDLADFLGAAGASDAVWGRRILRQDTLGRRASAAAWNRLVGSLFHLPVHDVDCGFKLIRRDVLQRFELQTGGAMISSELAVKCRAEGARITEIGIPHHPRVAGKETGGNPRVVLRAFGELARMYRTLRGLSRTSR
jgi:glycosyltransferase involved in cell wall biosynthesis